MDTNSTHVNIKKLLVTGGTGLVGSAIKLLEPMATFVASADYDLRDPIQVENMFKTHQPTHIIHLAGMVGGVKVNSQKPVEFFEENILINTLVMRYAHKYNVERLVAFMSTCIFPNEVEYPLQPHKMHLGAPHHSNFAYAYAKRMIEVQLKAYQQEYHKSWFAIIPTNVYGPHDNYHLENAHVIPALIHKCYLAKTNNTPWTIWGSGNAIREFIYSEDLAKIALSLLENYKETDPVIVSVDTQTTIRDVVELIAKHMNYTGEIIFDSSQPEGQQRKPSDITPLKSTLPDYKNISLDDGIRLSVEWFLNNYDILRK